MCKQDINHFLLSLINLSDKLNCLQSYITMFLIVNIVFGEILSPELRLCLMIQEYLLSYSTFHHFQLLLSEARLHQDKNMMRMY